MADVPSTFPRENGYNYSTEESESDAGDGKGLLRTNAFGEPKTSRHNRPPRSKRLLEKREKIATRKSKHILEMHEATKRKMNTVENATAKKNQEIIRFKVISLNIS